MLEVSVKPALLLLTSMFVVGGFAGGLQFNGASAQETNAGAIFCKGEEKAFPSFRKRLPYDSRYTVENDVEAVDLPRGPIVLRGYMAKARDEKGILVHPKGFILILPGNQMYAQHLVSVARFLSRIQYDVYIYDYRGYGSSNGETKVQLLIEDAKAVLAHLSSKKTAPDGSSYLRRHVYGISMGAAIAVNAFDDPNLLDRLILDGTPASASLRGFFICLVYDCMECPKEIDPVNRPYPLGPRTLILEGARDNVLSMTQDAVQQQQLIERAKSSRACVSEQPEFGHPFQDRFTAERLSIVGNFLDKGNDEDCPAYRKFTPK